MKVAITLHTTEYRGDHSEEVVVAHELAKEGETVGALVDRLLFQKQAGHRDFVPKYVDWIELRLVKEALNE